VKNKNETPKQMWNISLPRVSAMFISYWCLSQLTLDLQILTTTCRLELELTDLNMNMTCQLQCEFVELNYYLQTWPWPNLTFTLNWPWPNLDLGQTLAWSWPYLDPSLTLTCPGLSQTWPWQLDSMLTWLGTDLDLNLTWPSP
jgi:hypothetical protein